MPFTRGRGRPRGSRSRGGGAFGRRLYGGRGGGTAADLPSVGVRGGGGTLGLGIKRKIKVEIENEEPRQKSARLRSPSGSSGNDTAPSSSTDAPGVMRPPKRFEHSLVRPTWTVTDKETLVSALKVYGSKDVAALAAVIPYKDVKTVRDFIAKEKRNQNLVVELMRTSDLYGYAEPVVREREKDSAIETWIQGAEAKDRLASAAHAAPSGSTAPPPPSADASLVLPRMLEWIARYECHPPPDDCGGVHYEQIYEAVAALMGGDVPKDLNQATSQKLIELLSRLQASLSRACLSGELRSEMNFLESYRELSAHRTPAQLQLEKYGCSSLPRHSKSFYEIPGVNPFNLPTNMFHNNLISMKSDLQNG